MVMRLIQITICFFQMFINFGAIIKSLAIMMKVGNITYCVTLISRGYDYIHFNFV